MSGSFPPLTDTASADPLSSLQFLTDSVFLAGCSDGSVYVADVRAPGSPQRSPPPAQDAALWWTEASAACRVLRVSSSGLTLLSDLRNLGEAVSAAQLDTGALTGGVDEVRVSWAPALDGCIAISGECAAEVSQLKQGASA